MASSHRYAPTPIQHAFHQSPARIRGYGGAMGGGKSRAICEEALRYAIEWPGVPIVIARQSHTSIKETTKKTMLEQVIPTDWIAGRKASMGEDYIDLHNGSRIHFIGLDDPVRWYSAELGVLIVDQVEECDEDTVVKLITRLRHRCAPVGVLPDIPGYGEQAGKPVAGKVILSFNPANPGHWLQKWFILGGSQTEFGFGKPELFAEDADESMGDAEFFKAFATQNPYLPPGYVQRTLAALPAPLRRRMLEGLWEFITGNCFFDIDALSEYQTRVSRPRFVGETVGGGVGKRPDGPCKVRAGKIGPLSVWRPPVRGDKAHRYVVSVDVSSGVGADFSAIQVIDIEAFEQVAEWQAKLDPDLVAVEAYRLACIYNGALIVPEVTGGWGHTIVRECEKLIHKHKGGSKPRLYTRRVDDRVKKMFTDKLGWDTTAKSRAAMLDTLEQSLREREFVLHGERSLAELGTFVVDEKGRPAAQPGCNDDLVVALAIGVFMATTLPKQLRRVKPEKYQPQFSATGY